MKIGLISDTHGQVELTKKAADLFREHTVSEIIHCGDTTQVEHLRPLTNLGVPLHVVSGNMDWNQRTFKDLENRMGFTYHGISGLIEREGKKIAFTHGHHDSIMRQLKHESPDYILHGHTHDRRDETLNSTRVINPGAIKPPDPSCAILDLETDELGFYDVS